MHTDSLEGFNLNIHIQSPSIVSASASRENRCSFQKKMQDLTRSTQEGYTDNSRATGKVEASEGSSSTESSRHEEGADTKNATLRIMRGVKLLHRARGELGQGETSSSGDGRTTEARLGARWGKGLHESSRSEADLRVATPRSNLTRALFDDAQLVAFPL